MVPAPIWWIVILWFNFTLKILGQIKTTKSPQYQRKRHLCLRHLGMTQLPALQTLFMLCKSMSAALSQGFTIQWEPSRQQSPHFRTQASHFRKHRQSSARSRLLAHQRNKALQEIKAFETWESSSIRWELIEPPDTTTSYSTVTLSTAMDSVSCFQDHIASTSDKFLADSTCSFHQLEQGEIQANKPHDGQLFSVCPSGIKLDTSPRAILPNGIPDLTDLMCPLAPSQAILLQPTCYKTQDPNQATIDLSL